MIVKVFIIFILHHRHRGASINVRSNHTVKKKKNVKPLNVGAIIIRTVEIVARKGNDTP